MTESVFRGTCIRLGETSHDHNGKLFRAVKRLWEAKLLVRGSNFADLDFSETGLEVAECLFERWSGWDLYKQKYEIV